MTNLRPHETPLLGVHETGSGSFFPQEAVFETPKFGAVWLHDQVQTATIEKLVWPFAWFGVLDIELR